MTFLYFTLHYYSSVLASHHQWKLLITHSIIGELVHPHTSHTPHLFVSSTDSQSDAHPLDWYFTPPVCELLRSHTSNSWNLSSSYFHSLLTRLLHGLTPFDLTGPVAEWHFTEFASPMTFALYCSLVELMCLPLSGPEVVRHLITTAYDKWGVGLVGIVKIELWPHRAAEGVSESELMSWINAVTLVIVSLPVRTLSCGRNIWELTYQAPCYIQIFCCFKALSLRAINWLRSDGFQN